jgi:hypothetical protein
MRQVSKEELEKCLNSYDGKLISEGSHLWYYYTIFYRDADNAHKVIGKQECVSQEERNYFVREDGEYV